jgi:hypothetical protein
MSSHEQNPALSTHIKMFFICIGTAVALFGAIAIGFRQAYELVMWIGSR